MAVVASDAQERQEALAAMQQRQELNLELMAEHLLAERNQQKTAEAHLRNWTTEKDKEVGMLYNQAVESHGQIKDLNQRLAESQMAFEQKCYTSLGGYLSSLTPQGVCAKELAPAG